MTPHQIGKNPLQIGKSHLQGVIFCRNFASTTKRKAHVVGGSSEVRDKETLKFNSLKTIQL
jgi:hypothetical protein